MIVLKIKQLTKTLSANLELALLAVSFLFVPLFVKAQQEQYVDEQGVLVSTSDSRLAVTILETADNLEFQVTVIGEIYANSFYFPIVYDTLVLRLSDPSYTYEAPDGSAINNLGYPVVVMPTSFTDTHTGYITSAKNHFPVEDGPCTGMKMFCPNIGTASLNATNVDLSSGDIKHLFSFYFKKVNPGTPLKITDFGYYAQPPANPMKPIFSPLLMYGTFEIRYASTQPWIDHIVKPDLFTFRSPSSVITEYPTNIAENSATLNATFNRGNFQPTNDIVVSQINQLYGTHRLNWDNVTKYGFIYSEINADITVNGFTNQLNIDGTDYDFPDAAELAAGMFIRNGKTFYTQQPTNNSSSNQNVAFSQNITGLSGEVYYYAWSFINYSFETSNEFLNVGNKIMFKTTPHCIPPYVEVENFVYCDGENVPEYSFSGSGYADFIWERVVGYDFGLMQTEGVNTIPAFVATNVGFEAISAIYKVTPVSEEEGCDGEPKNFMITVNPRPTTSPVEDMVYCNGTTAPRYDFASNIPDAFFEWEFVSGTNVLDITSGENYLPSFETYNTGNEPITGTYKVIASYSFSNLTCYEYEWNEFTITILPTPVSITATPVLQTICSGEETAPIIFSSSVGDVIYKWSFNSGDILPGFPTEGVGNIPSSVIHNNGLMAISATYNVWTELNYEDYPEYSCISEKTTFGIIVSPAPYTEVVNDFVYCSGTVAPVYYFTGNNPLATYNWEYVSGDVIQGIPTSGLNQFPSFMAINNSENVLIANYKVTASYGDLCPETDGVTFSVVILPTPNVVVTPSYQVITSGETISDIQFNSNATEVIYQWERISGYIPELPQSGTGDIAGMQIFNNGLMPIEATYKVFVELNYEEYPYYTCTGASSQFTIVVNPESYMGEVSDFVYCNGETAPAYTFTGTHPLATYQWEYFSGDVLPGIPQSGVNNFPSFVAINNGNEPVIANYRVKTTLNGGSSDWIYFSVTVMPNIDLDIMPVVLACSSEPTTTILFENKIHGIEYKLIFDPIAINEGFVSIIDFTALPQSEIIVPIPNDVSVGNYHATLTVKLGNCKTDYDVMIAVKGSFIVTNMSETDITLCENETLNLFVEATGNVQYQWYFNDEWISDENSFNYETIFSAEKEGVYTVVIFNECSSQTYNFYVNINPIMIEQKWDDVLYIDNSENIYVEYQWYKNGNPITVDGKSQYYKENGGCFTKDAEYNVRAYKADGTYDEACPIIPNDGTCTGSSELLVYPNPVFSGNKLTFLLKGDEHNATANIIDMRGRLVGTYHLTDYQTEIVVTYASGSYVVHVITESGKEFLEKIIIQNK